VSRIQSVDAFIRTLFQGDARRVFAILDGAIVDDLPARLASSGLPHECLFPGELDPELAAVMPYLVELESSAPLVREALSRGWKDHWGIYGCVPEAVTFLDLRQHFRPFLKVQGPMGQFMFFRYYDPRVLRHTLPTFDEEQMSAFFGPVQALWFESGEGAEITHYFRERAGAPRVLQYETGGG
jgi:hypothetical protein